MFLELCCTKPFGWKTTKLPGLEIPENGGFTASDALEA